MRSSSFIELATRYTIKCLVLVNAVWLYFLVHGAILFHDHMTHKAIAIGPLVINNLDRTPLPSGAYTLHLNFAPGFLWLELIAVGLGCLITCLHMWLTKHNQNSNNSV